MFKLRRFLKDYKKECIIGPLCKLFEAILELLVPLVMARIIDVGIANRDPAYVWGMGGLLVGLAVLGWSSAMFTQYFASRASQGAGTKIRRALYEHINLLSHAELDSLGTPHVRPLKGQVAFDGTQEDAYRENRLLEVHDELYGLGKGI